MSNLEVKWPFMGTLNWTEEDHSGPIVIRGCVLDEAEGDWVCQPPIIWTDS